MGSAATACVCIDCRVTGKRGDIRLKGLVDTGNRISTGCAISTELARALGVSVKPSTANVGTARKDNFLRVVGETVEPLYIEMKGLGRIQTPALVLGELSHHLNLGSNLLHREKLTLEFSEDGAKLFNKKKQVELIEAINCNSTDLFSTNIMSCPVNVNCKDFTIGGGYGVDKPGSKGLIMERVHSIGTMKTLGTRELAVPCTQKSAMKFVDDPAEDWDGTLGTSTLEGVAGVPVGQLPDQDNLKWNSSSVSGKAIVKNLKNKDKLSTDISAVSFSGPLGTEGDHVTADLFPGVKGEVNQFNIKKPNCIFSSGCAAVLEEAWDKASPLTDKRGPGKTLEIQNVNSDQVVGGREIGIEQTGCSRDYLGKVYQNNIEEIENSDTVAAVFNELRQPDDGYELDKETRRLFQELQLDANPYLQKNPGTDKALRKLLTRYKEVFANEQTKFGLTNLVQCKLRLKPGTKPIKQKRRPLNPLQLKELKSQVQDWLKQGIVRPSKSPWCTPIVFVKKRDQTTRICLDFRALNNVIESDGYPLPRIAEVLEKLGGKRIFSTLDASNAYQCIPMDPDSRELTAFSTPFGHFEFLRMPFGLKPAVAEYSRLAAKALEGVEEENVECYLDDCLAHTVTDKEHLRVLEALFKAHLKAGIKLKPSKTKLFQTEVDFLGYRVSEEGIGMQGSYVQRILDWPRPKTAKEVRSLLGFFSYYRESIQNFSELTYELNGLRNSRKPIVWTSSLERDFSELKKAFGRAPLRAFPRFDDSAEPFILTTDYSKKAISAILSQEQNGKERMIACCGRKTTKCESNYGSTKGEAAALMYGVRKFSSILRYKRFIAVTDNSALKYLKDFKDPKGIFFRWIEELGTYDFIVRHKPGKLNVNADLMSRADHLPPPTKEEEDEQLWPVEEIPSLSPAYIRLAQQRDMVLSKVKSWVRTGRIPSREEMRGQPRALHVYRGKIGYLKEDPRGILVEPGEEHDVILVPESLQREVFKWVHEHRTAGHWGLESTLQRAKQFFFFPNMASYLEGEVRTCPLCIAKQTKVNHRTGEHVPRRHSYPGERIYIDLIGPMPETNRGFRYILTVLDGFTRFAMAYPLKNKETNTVARTLLEEYICTWGCPVEVHSDQGTEFTSSVFRELMKLLRVNLTFCPVENPQSNLVERFHRSLNSMFRVFLDREDTTWDRWLAPAVFCYNTKTCSSTGQTPFKAMFGREATLPLHLVMEVPQKKYENVHEFVKSIQNRFTQLYKYMMARNEDVIKRNSSLYEGESEDWKEGDLVWYFCQRKVPGKPAKLTNGWLGPFIVVSRVAKVLCKIKPAETEGRERVVHNSRLRRYLEGRGRGNIPTRLNLEDDEDEAAEELRKSGPKPSVELGIPIRIGVPEAMIVDQAVPGTRQGNQTTVEPKTAEDVVEEPVEAPVRAPEMVVDRIVPEGEMVVDEPVNPSKAEGEDLMKTKTRMLTRAVRRQRESSDSEDLPKPMVRKPRLMDSAKKLLESSEESSDWDSSVEVLKDLSLEVLVKTGSKMPVKGSAEAAAYDLTALHNCTLNPRQVTAVDVNLSIAMPQGYFLQLVSRSGLAKKGIVTVAGCIDSDYRGKILALLLNTTDRPFSIKKGQRVTSGVFLKHYPANFQDVEVLPSSVRGTSGFGSSDG